MKKLRTRIAAAAMATGGMMTMSATAAVAAPISPQVPCGPSQYKAQVITYSQPNRLLPGPRQAYLWECQKDGRWRLVG